MAHLHAWVGLDLWHAFRQQVFLRRSRVACGLPVALMEALALDLPVVATSVGGIATALADATAIVIAPGDSAALASSYVAMVEKRPMPPEPQPRFEASESARRLAELYAGVHT